VEGKTITALMVAPGEHPSVTNLCCCKQFLDLAVSFGAMEPCDVTFMPLSERACILYNREAPLLDLRGNRKIDSHILAGVFYIIGLDHGKLVSLPDDLMEHYMERFWEPETYSEKVVEQAFWRNWLDEIDDILETPKT